MSHKVQHEWDRSICGHAAYNLTGACRKLFPNTNIIIIIYYFCPSYTLYVATRVLI